MQRVDAAVSGRMARKYLVLWRLSCGWKQETDRIAAALMATGR